MVTRLLACAAGILLVTAPCSAASQQAASWDPVTQVLGRTGTPTGGAYRVNFPRSDFRVTVRGLAIDPALALTSWAAFAGTPDSSMVVGDLVLGDQEVDSVIRSLVDGGIQVTAIHHHLVGETPRVLYVHYMGQGRGTVLAAAVRRALKLTATPLGDVPPPARIVSVRPDTARVFAQLGVSGRLNGAVMAFSVPTSGSHASAHGQPIPAGLGMNTVINLQSAGRGRYATTGDFVLTADKVRPVQQALLAGGISVTALHNHMLDEEPRAFFMHFWGAGPADTILRGLKDALSAAQ